MGAFDVSRLPATSPMHAVAQSSAADPEFLLAEGPRERFVTARWRRRKALLERPLRLDRHLLSYCERGGGALTVTVDGVRHHGTQHAGSVIFVPAGRDVHWRLDDGSEVVHLHVYIDAGAAHDALGAAGVGRLQPLVNVHDPWLDGFFRLVAAEVESCRCRGRLHDFDLLGRLAAPLLRRLAELPAGDDAPAPGVRVAPLRPHLVRAVQACIERELGHRVTLERLAEVAAMSVDHFVRAFAQATGATPHRYLLERRLDAARERLRAGTERIDVIARACGFVSTPHFSAAFKRRYGATPSAYRRAEP